MIVEDWRRRGKWKRWRGERIGETPAAATHRVMPTSEMTSRCFARMHTHIHTRAHTNTHTSHSIRTWLHALLKMLIAVIAKILREEEAANPRLSHPTSSLFSPPTSSLSLSLVPTCPVRLSVCPSICLSVCQSVSPSEILSSFLSSPTQVASPARHTRISARVPQRLASHPPFDGGQRRSRDVG